MFILYNNLIQWLIYNQSIKICDDLAYKQLCIQLKPSLL